MKDKKALSPAVRSRHRLRAALIVLLCYVVGSMAFTVVFFRLFFARWDRGADNVTLRYEDVDSTAYPRESFTFACGRNTLQGYLYPAEDSIGVVVIAHGMHSGADEHLPEILYFIDHGWTVLAFDGTGSCGSTGATIRGLAQMTIDLLAALDWLDAQPALCDLPTVLYGHSMGGYAVTAALAEDPNVDAVVSIGGFNTPTGIMTSLAEQYVGPVCYIGWPFLWLENKLLFDDYATIPAVNAVNLSDVPVLVVWGSEDETVAKDVSIYGHADEVTREGVTFLLVEESPRNEHTTTWLSADSAQRYLDAEEELKALHREYGDPLPETVHDAFFDSLDTDTLFTLDEDFMDTVNAFYLDAIQ